MSPSKKGEVYWNFEWLNDENCRQKEKHERHDGKTVDSGHQESEWQGKRTLCCSHVTSFFNFFKSTIYYTERDGSYFVTTLNRTKRKRKRKRKRKKKRKEKEKVYTML